MRLRKIPAATRRANAPARGVPGRVTGSAAAALVSGPGAALTGAGAAEEAEEGGAPCPARGSGVGLTGRQLAGRRLALEEATEEFALFLQLLHFLRQPFDFALQ